METIDKATNLSQAKAKSMFKKYATSIVKELRLKGIKMIKESECHNGVDCFYWDSCITKNSRAKIYIGIYHEKTSSQYIKYVDLVMRIDYQSRDETDLEKMVRIKTEDIVDKIYPLSNAHVLVPVENPKIPKLNPEKVVAKHLYWALKYNNKINNPETISKIKKSDERIKKLTKNEANKIVESFF